MVERYWKVLGLMSGTSLDGLDIALCEFKTTEGRITDYKILDTITFEYGDSEKRMLDVMNSSAETFAEADHSFGKYCGEKIKEFTDNKGWNIDFVSSHGHTIFHQPHKGFTSQIGNGAVIAATCKLPVVSDFRSMDVALGGQGAPLVPIGDLLLFSKYKYCLNLGGIANISVQEHDSVKAFDICPANMALNHFSLKKGLPYDSGGLLAASGKVNLPLVNDLNSLTYYKMPAPKSLGKEWFDHTFIALINQYNEKPENILATLCEHISIQIADQIKDPGEILITGGGALNNFLIEKIKEKVNGRAEVQVPEKELVCFKEALIFAFLGLLRILDQPNALSSVTGASQNSIGGALYGRIRGLIP